MRLFGCHLVASEGGDKETKQKDNINETGSLH